MNFYTETSHHIFIEAFQSQCLLLLWLVSKQLPWWGFKHKTFNSSVHVKLNSFSCHNKSLTGFRCTSTKKHMSDFLIISSQFKASYYSVYHFCSERKNQEQLLNAWVFSTDSHCLEVNTRNRKYFGIQQFSVLAALLHSTGLSAHESLPSKWDNFLGWDICKLVARRVF